VFKSEEIEKINAYILNVKQAIDSVKTGDLEPKVKELIELARIYLDDARYYFEKKEYFTALACIAYAEGLIDSLNRLGFINIEWKPLSELMNRPKVLVTGAFEIIHPGHLYLFKKAWEKGRVYVIIARDKNFEKFKKRPPVIPEEQRRVVVENIKYVHKAVLGDENDLFKPILEIKPDVILLGPDQWIDEEYLKTELCKRELCNVEIIRLKERIGSDLYSVSNIIKKILEIHRRSGLDPSGN